MLSNFGRITDISRLAKLFLMSATADEISFQQLEIFARCAIFFFPHVSSMPLRHTNFSAIQPGYYLHTPFASICYFFQLTRSFATALRDSISLR